MTDQQEYNVFMAKFSDKIRELRKDFSELSDTNQRRFVEMCQTVLDANGIVVAMEVLEKYLG